MQHDAEMAHEGSGGGCSLEPQELRNATGSCATRGPGCIRQAGYAWLSVAFVAWTAQKGGAAPKWGRSSRIPCVAQLVLAFRKNRQCRPRPAATCAGAPRRVRRPPAPGCRSRCEIVLTRVLSRTEALSAPGIGRADACLSVTPGPGGRPSGRPNRFPLIPTTRVRNIREVPPPAPGPGRTASPAPPAPGPRGAAAGPPRPARRRPRPRRPPAREVPPPAPARRSARPPSAPALEPWPPAQRMD
jgi:hypothetical protein